MGNSGNNLLIGFLVFSVLFLSAQHGYGTYLLFIPQQGLAVVVGVLVRRIEG